MPLTKIELDIATANGCQEPGCTHQHDKTLYLHGTCHPRARVDVSYTQGTGILRVTCSVCSRLIAEVAVADTERHIK